MGWNYTSNGADKLDILAGFSPLYKFSIQEQVNNGTADNYWSFLKIITVKYIYLSKRICVDILFDKTNAGSPTVYTVLQEDDAGSNFVLTFNLRHSFVWKTNENS